MFAGSDPNMAHCSECVGHGWVGMGWGLGGGVRKVLGKEMGSEDAEGEVREDPIGSAAIHIVGGSELCT